MVQNRISRDEGGIAGCYFVGNIDPQYGVKRDGNVAYVRGWLDSIKRRGMQATLFHDGLPERTVRRLETRYPCQCVRVTPAGRSGIDDRWRVYCGWLRGAPPCRQVFFTDVSDVVCLSRPWPELQPGHVYIGSETEASCGTGWIEARVEQMIAQGVIRRDLWEQRFRRIGNVALNPGVIGGDTVSLLPFLEKMASLLDSMDYEHETYDMVAANYVLPDPPTTLVTGEPVHTVYRAFDRRRGDCWFAHK